MLEKPEARARLRRKLEAWKKARNPVTVNQGLELLDLFDSLEKQADWLADTLARWDERFSLTGKPPKDATYWRAEARRAVEEQK